MSEVLNELGRYGLVPVVTLERAEDASALMDALLAGGLPCAEITFRTAAAEEAIHQIGCRHPDLLVGAGTVLTRGQAERAVAAGARFIVSPGFDLPLVEWCLENRVPVTPGVATPTEISMALAKGLHILKFFPAEALGGVKTLNAITGAYRDVRFIPTGGISDGNLADYLSLTAVHCCGASWPVETSLISAGCFEEITKRAMRTVEIVRQVRG